MVASRPVNASDRCLRMSFGQPLLCVAALAAAWCSRYLTAATIGVAAMTVVDLAAITVFAIGVTLYGV